MEMHFKFQSEGKTMLPRESYLEFQTKGQCDINFVFITWPV